MTYELLTKIIEENHIPKDVKMMSDSGWECSETEMDGIFYNKEENTLIFTQKGDQYSRWYERKGWVCIYGKLKNFRDENGYDYYKCFHEPCKSNVDCVCYRKDRTNCPYYDGED